jgi:hypothetical protein
MPRHQSTASGGLVASRQQFESTMKYFSIVAFLVAVAVGVVFGGGDQYLGSLAAIPWLTSFSLLSAPWLVLPFVFGCTQLQPRRAMLIGALATGSALLGYFVMTLSPVEAVHLSGNSNLILGLLRSESRVIVGGVVTGPFYGFLGQRWRTTRAWLSAVLVAGAVCFEPLVESSIGRLPRPAPVWISEVTVGVIMTGYFLTARLANRRSIDSDAYKSA